MKTWIIIILVLVTGNNFIAGQYSNYSLNQYYVIPENSENNDDVGVFIPWYHVKDSDKYYFKITAGNDANIFKIDSISGNIKINSNNNLNISDTYVYKIVIKTYTNKSYDKDTAFIKVVEEKNCVFIDPSSTKESLGTRSNPYKSWKDVKWLKGTGYFQKRGTTYNYGITILTSGAESDPIILGAYGVGPRPIIDGLRKDYNNKGLYLGNFSTPAHYFEVYNFNILNFNMHGIMVAPDSKHMLFCNIKIDACGTAGEKQPNFWIYDTKDDSEKDIKVVTLETSRAAEHGIKCQGGGTEVINLLAYDNPGGSGIQFSGDLKPYIQSYNSSLDGALLYNNDIGLNIQGDTITAKNVVTCYNKNHGVVFFDEPRNNKIFNIYAFNNRYGVFVSGIVTNADISNVYSYRNYMHGVFVTSQSNDITISKSTIYDNKQYGILIRNNPYHINVFYNKIFNNDSAGIGILSSNVVNIYNNTIYNKTNNQDIAIRSNSSNFKILNNIAACKHDASQNIYNFDYTNTDVKFYDAQTNNFRLLYNSPAINAGKNLNFTTDFYNNDIVDNPDIGAIEFVQNENPKVEDASFNIDDTIKINSLIGKIIASDPDEEQTLTYEIIDGNQDNYFSLNNNGELFLANNITIDKDRVFDLIVKVKDNLSFYDLGLINVFVSHVSSQDNLTNNPPVIQNQEITIYDNLQIGTIIGTAEATDSDNDQTLTYNIIDGNYNNWFLINSGTGDISINNQIVISDNTNVDILVKAVDNGPGSLSDTGLVAISIIHFDNAIVNNQPVINNQEFDIETEDNLNSLVMEIKASDPDPEQNLIYSIESGNNEQIFSLNSSSGHLTVSDPTKINFKTNKTYILNVMVQDDGEGMLSNSADIEINIIAEITTFYIDPTNINDPEENGSVEHPYDSWSDVKWKEGDTYLQKKGTTVNEGKINIYASNVSLGAYGDGDKPIINSLASDFAIRAFDKYNLTIRGLRIQANNAISCIYILGPSCDNNVIEYCHLEGGDNGVRIIDGGSITLRYNTFSDNEDAIYSYAETNKIYYNIFNGNGTGININSYLSSSEIFNNVFYDNSKGVSASYSSLTVYNNIFYLTDQGDQAINHKMDNLVSDNNIFYPEQDGFLDINDQKYSSLYDYQQSSGLDMNSFTSDPLFKDVYNDNFSVEVESPAIDAGKNVGIMMDFYGYNVPFGGAPDIGLIELVDDYQENPCSVFDNEDDDNSPLIFPNPSDGYFKISLNDINFQTTELQIKNVAGSLIYHDYLEFDIIDQTVDIDISDAPKGIYLVFLAVDDKIYSQRIIVN